MDKIKYVQCNQCGERASNNPKGTHEDIIKWNLMHSFNVKFAYGSDYDFMEGSFWLCENCLLCIVNNFKIPIKLKEY